MPIPFTKASACGNDFLIIDAQHRPADPAAFTRQLCHRTRGVGADGVEWVAISAATDPGFHLEAHLINSDGSPAQISGNGTRCVAAWWLAQLRERNQQIPAPLRIRTGAGVKTFALISHSASHFEFESEMGVPAIHGEVALDFSGEAKLVSGIVLSTGNPHFVVFVDSFDFAWQQLGARLQAHNHFAEQGTNVEFVRILDQHTIEARFFERGAGETSSSGTGSCASALAAIHARRASSPVRVVAVGGSQQVRWDGPSHPVFLRGPADIICSGEYHLEQ